MTNENINQPELEQQPEEVVAEQEAQEIKDAKEPPAASEKTEAELLTEKNAQLNDQLLRTMAEYDNFRKRSQRERDAIYPQATSAAVAHFLPIVDTIERALEAPCSDAEYKKGVEMILQNFKDALGKMNVEAFGEVGETFDPEMHNAVMHAEDEAAPVNSIAEVFQKGYRMGDRVIRFAMVRVVN